MKKSIILVLAAFMLFITGVSAMSESELEAKLTAAYTINGTTFQVNAAQKSQIHEYLAKNDISESDCDYIASQVDEAIKVIDDSNVTSLKDLSQSYRNKLSTIASNISKNTAVKVTLSSNGTLTVYNTDGTVFTTISTVIKNTSELGILYIAGAISILGALYFANKVKKANN